MILKSTLTILVLTGFFNASSQKLYRLPLKTLDGPDGMVIDKQNNIYIANWGRGGKGTTVTKFTTAGSETIFLDSLSSPDGLAFDEKENLFVSCFASGEILKISYDKSKRVYASGLDHPSDIKFDGDGNLYVSCFGNYNGSKVLKIDPSGNKTIFTDSMSVPLGLVFDNKFNLYVSNFASGAIYKIDRSGHKTLYAQLPDPVTGYFQYLAFDNSGNLYCPSYGHNCIYKIDRAQQIYKLPTVDETGSEVKLNGPNSIYIKNDYLYFTEFNTNSAYHLKL